jgi:uncharacterized protein YndB with AHSA1/START domain
MAETISFTIKTTLAAKPERIFKALTDSDEIKAWSGQRGIVEPMVDGYVEFFDGWVKGEVISYKPGKEVAYTWRPDEWELKWEDSEVLIALKPIADGTEVTLMHDNLPTQKEADSHHEGWFKNFLDPLKEYLKD